MGQPALKIQDDLEENKDKQKGITSREKVENTETEEIVLGVCSPIGSLKIEVIEELKNTLSYVYGYEVKTIKLSDLIIKHQFGPSKSLTGKTQKYSDLLHKINEGNRLREEYTRSILADLAIQEINRDRYERFNISPSEVKNGNYSEKLKGNRVCYVIDSLKNLEELYLFRKIYRSIFYSFSIFSSREERIEKLKGNELSHNEAIELIDKDEFENRQNGQNVRETFIESDFFFRVSSANKEEIKEKIERYLHLIFNSKVVTPLPHEQAMYIAKSVAGNSSCLSRQVGASITDEKGEIIAKGWNDVPKYGGGLYNEGSSIDHRCFLSGVCSNDKEKDQLAKAIADELNRSGLDLSAKQQNNLENVIRKSKIKDLLEFSRSVHAEMHAIISGSQISSNRMVNGKLFCTTYPCHNCARHIIVAGIKEVYYIEPYIKSLCTKLHEDAITEDEKDDKKVRILIYDGVAPRRFLEFFTKKLERKNSNGDLIKPKLNTLKPKNRLTLQALDVLEHQTTHVLNDLKFFENNEKEE